jgi:putative SOS response-associated peptidase YedK
MCGRTIIGDVDWPQYFEWMSILSAPSTAIRHSWNVAPTTINPIFLPTEGGLIGGLARWGLVPEWWKKPLKELKFATFNARSEEAAEKPTFRHAMQHGHCLVPAKGYYEWTGKKGNKTPYMVSVETNAPGFCMAGLYTRVSLPDYEGLTYTILTEPAEGVLQGLHPRMPVMLDETTYKSWTRGEPLAALPRIKAERIRFRQVSKAVGSVSNDGPELIVPMNE